MSASLLLALAVLLATGVVAAFGQLLHRDLAQIADELTRSGHQPDLGRHLDEVRDEAHALHQQHTHALDTRFRQVEAAVAAVERNNTHLGRYVGSMWPVVEPWIQAERR